MLLCLAGISIIFSLRWFLMANVASVEQIIYIQMLHCITFGIYYYIGTQLSVMLVPAEFRASGQALYAVTYGGISGIVAGLLGGGIFDQYGPQAMYQLCGYMAASGLIGFLLLYVRHSRIKETDQA